MQSPDDPSDLVGHCFSAQADRLFLFQKNIHPHFFDLKTKLAGEVLQKFSTYRLKLAIVGDFSNYESKSDFIYESNKTGHSVFAAGVKQALQSFRH